MERLGYRDWSAGIVKYERWLRRRRWTRRLAVTLLLIALVALGAWWLQK